MAGSADAVTAPAPHTPPPKNPLRRIYHWILSWANHPWGTLVLAILSFLDSFVFPIPPLFLQVALSLERPKRSFWYAFVDTAASVAGAIAGYWIGYALWDSIGVRIIGELSEEKRMMLKQNQFVVTLVYSFVPMPFKFITLGSGFLHLSISSLLVASTLGRSARFFALAAVCFVYGPRARGFIDRHFNTVCVAIGAGLAIIIVAAKVILK